MEIINTYTIGGQTVHHGRIEPELDGFPADWIEQIHNLRHEAAYVKTEGRGPGSLEDEETAGLDYHVLHGSKVAELLPWMMAWYRNPATLAFVGSCVGEEVVETPNPHSTININILQGPNGRYEWHLDPAPYTMVLYATGFMPHEGGALAVGDQDNPILIHPRTGEFVLFDGSVVPHAVTPLTIHALRISLPIEFVAKRFAGKVPDIDWHLYGLEKTESSSEKGHVHE